MLRATVVQTGYIGAPGYTNLFAEHTDPPSTAASALVSAVGVFFNAISVYMGGAYAWTIQSDVAVVEDIDGTIDSYISTTPPTQSVFGSGGAYAAAGGACVDWLTSGVVNSHRVMGRTFLVPMSTGSFQSDGTLTSTVVSGVQAAANAYIAAAGFDPVIWSRPYTAVPGKPRPTTPGSHYVVTAARVPDKQVVLRSRRD